MTWFMIKICSVRRRNFMLFLFSIEDLPDCPFSNFASNVMCVKHGIYSQKRCSIFADVAPQGETGPWWKSFHLFCTSHALPSTSLSFRASRSQGIKTSALRNRTGVYLIRIDCTDPSPRSQGYMCRPFTRASWRLEGTIYKAVHFIQLAFACSR